MLLIIARCIFYGSPKFERSARISEKGFSQKLAAFRAGDYDEQPDHVDPL